MLPGGQVYALWADEKEVAIESLVHHQLPPQVKKETYLNAFYASTLTKEKYDEYAKDYR
jgi:hypothetical protein